MIMTLNRARALEDTKERLLTIASRSITPEESQAFIQQLRDSSARGINLSAALALYLIDDLCDDDSTDKANLNRVTTNLEAAAEDLLTMSRLMKNL